MMEYNYNSTGSEPKHEQPRDNAAEELRKKNKILTYALIGLGALILIGAIAYFATRKKESTTTGKTTNIVKIDSAAVVVDSPIVKRNLPEYEDGEDGEYYSTEYNIANEAYLRATPSVNSQNLGSLKFGDKVYTDNSYSSDAYKKVYLTEPSGDQKPQAYYVANYVLTYPGEFEDFKKYFSLPPFSGIGTKMKKLILDNDYVDGRQYHVSQNAARAKSTFAYGDYDRDGITDFAVVLDDNENQYSRLLILCTNAATKEPYLAYAENYSDKLQINAFKKNALIFMDTSALTNAPSDGLIIRFENGKYAVLYDTANQKFRTYNQSQDTEYED